LVRSGDPGRHPDRRPRCGGRRNHRATPGEHSLGRRSRPDSSVT
jgi:hypothetical protein